MSGTDYDLCICVHAESNALLTAGRFGASTDGTTVYTTDQPCFSCSKELIQAGVVKVVLRPFVDTRRSGSPTTTAGSRNGSMPSTCRPSTRSSESSDGAESTTSANPRPNKVVVVLLDSLNRHLLGAYGSDEFDTPNLDRFAATARSVFDRHHVGSLPCMPARHDLLVGSLDFLWRPWGSIEVWEEAITTELRRRGVTTVLVSDHPHLFETGGENYHVDFTAWDYVRGHENDPWRTRPDPSWVGAPALPAATRSPTATATTTAAPGSATRPTSPAHARCRRRPSGCGATHRTTIRSCC